MTPRHPSDEAMADRAAAWVARCDRGLTAREQLEFDRWRCADSRHETALEQARRAWREMDALRTDAGLDALADIVLARARQRRARRRRATIMLATCTAAAAAIAFLVGLPRRGADRAVETTAAPATEHVRVLASTVQRMPLPDGSTAELNGNSRVEVAFIAAERRVVLLEGEAHFIVAKDSARPFFVTAGPLTVRAVGTAFNVRLGASAVEVLVTEGTVKLERSEPAASATEAVDAAVPTEAPALIAGQRAVVDRSIEPASSAPAVAIVDVDAVAIEHELGWQSTRLVFNNTPLPQVIAAFNRFNTRQLVLGDPALRSRTLTGVFRVDNLDGFERLLRAASDVRAERRTPDETVLLPVR